MRMPLILLTMAWIALSPPAAAAQSASRYLVDGRVYVALLFREDGSGGALSWRDTVSGRSGGVPFSADGATLRFAPAEGSVCRAYLVPPAAVVFDAPPWQPARRRPALGLALD
ncbi:MAG: hypothetical protein Kow0092_04120 [Deferrisomatales bacterium]